MIEITLIKDPAEVECLCRENGAGCPAGTLAYRMTQGGRKTGLCLFCLEAAAARGVLLLVAAEEEGLLLADGLIRSAVSWLYDRGAARVFAAQGTLHGAKPDAEALLFRRLGFGPAQGGWELEVTENFFKGCCAGK